jgi:hypothetical protein
MFTQIRFEPRATHAGDNTLMRRQRSNAEAAMARRAARSGETPSTIPEIAPPNP